MVEDGALDTGIAITSRDEIGRLTRSLNSMVGEAELERTAHSFDGGRRLRHRLPEFGIVAEEDARAAAFKHLQPVK